MPLCVCDVPVSQCPKWAEHCHATDTGKDAQKWKCLMTSTPCQRRTRLTG